MLLLLQAGKVPMTRGDQAIFENRRHSYTDVYAPKEPAYTPPPAQAPEMRAVFPHLFWSELKAIADFFNAVQDLKRHNAHAVEADKINLDSFEAISTPTKLADTIRANRWERLYRQLTLSIHSDRTVGKSERTRELAVVVMKLLANLNDMIKDDHQANPMENAPIAVVVGPIKDRL